jgi:hypothetical protein
MPVRRDRVVEPVEGSSNLRPVGSTLGAPSLKLLKNITRKYHLTTIDFFGYLPKRLEIFTSRENNLLIATLRLGCALQQALETDL